MFICMELKSRFPPDQRIISKLSHLSRVVMKDCNWVKKGKVYLTLMGKFNCGKTEKCFKLAGWKYFVI